MADTRPVLLVIEDDLGLQKQMRWSFDRFDVVFAEDRESAITQLRRHEPAVVTLDLGLPPNTNTPDEGFAVMEAILSLAPNTKIVAVTGQNDRNNALRAIATGAYDFFSKPFDAETLGLVVDRAFNVAELERENQRRSAFSGTTPLEGLITRDPGMIKLCRQIEKLAPTDASVLLLGESGTGKEVLARGLHAQSPRSENRFVPINCAAIPEALLESELFGHEKGAFTGAVKQTAGKIELAAGGTLFLDEIGDLPMSLQAKLLRFLQDRVIERVGGRTEIAIDLRIVCATHRNLSEQIRKGEFREDLYYRLTEMIVTIPPLRERAGDAPLLARAFMKRFAVQHKREKLFLRDDALRAIADYPWPGNVRELENCIKRAVIMAEASSIGAEDLGINNELELPALNLRRIRDDAERKAVLGAMAQSGGNIARASELLGISRPTMYDLLNRFGLREKQASSTS